MFSRVSKLVCRGGLGRGLGHTFELLCVECLFTRMRKANWQDLCDFCILPLSDEVIMELIAQKNFVHLSSMCKWLNGIYHDIQSILSTSLYTNNRTLFDYFLLTNCKMHFILALFENLNKTLKTIQWLRI